MNPFETRQYWDWQAKTRGTYRSPIEKNIARSAVIERIRTKQHKATDVYLAMLNTEFSKQELEQVIVLVQADLLFASWDVIDAQEARVFLSACLATLRDSF